MTFAPSSSAELDDILAEIRTKILLPSYLPQVQRKKLYSPRFEHRLRSDPITMEIDGQQLRLTHVDLFRDVPNSRRMLHAALDRMRSRADFDNLPRLLEGLHHAGRRLRADDAARVARRAGAAGHVYAVIECARTARRTGFRLDASEKAAEVLAWVQLRAVDAAWARPDTEQALRWADMVLAMLEDELHAAEEAAPPPPPGRSGRGGARRRPTRASRCTATRSSWPRACTSPPPWPSSTAPAPTPTAAWPGPRATSSACGPPAPASWTCTRRASCATPRARCTTWWRRTSSSSSLRPSSTPMDLAMQVVDPELAAELRSRRDPLKAEVDAALAEAAPDGRGAAMYKKLFPTG